MKPHIEQLRTSATCTVYKVTFAAVPMKTPEKMYRATMYPNSDLLLVSAWVNGRVISKHVGHKLHTVIRAAIEEAKQNGT